MLNRLSKHILLVILFDTGAHNNNNTVTFNLELQNNWYRLYLSSVSAKKFFHTAMSHNHTRTSINPACCCAHSHRKLMWGTDIKMQISLSNSETVQKRTCDKCKFIICHGPDCYNFYYICISLLKWIGCHRCLYTPTPH